MSAGPLVVGRRRAPRAAARGAVVDGKAVGLLFADGDEELERWRAARARAGREGIAVCAMGKDVYLDLAGRWITQLRDAGREVADLRASVADREALLDALAAGPALLLYAGHGRARGWAGYQTVRWKHVEARPVRRPAGAVVALACDTLTRTRAAVPFGVRLVQEGRAAAYLGAAAPLRIPDGMALGDRLIEELATGRHLDLGALLRATSAGIERDGDRAGRRALRALRLVGDPQVRLPVDARAAGS